MKGNFFTQLKNYLLERHKDELGKFIPYYETLLQQQENLESLLKDAENHHLDFHYHGDEDGGYSEGYFTVHLYTNDPYSEKGWQSSVGYSYIIKLLNEDRMTGYCECSPEHEGYNPIHDCTGHGCDWYAPSISITKVYGIAHFSFNGYQRDLWELEEKWIENKQEHEDKLKRQQIEYIKQQIEELEEQLNFWENK